MKFEQRMAVEVAEVEFRAKPGPEKEVGIYELSDPVIIDPPCAIHTPCFWGLWRQNPSPSKSGAEGAKQDEGDNLKAAMEVEHRKALAQFHPLSLPGAVATGAHLPASAFFGQTSPCPRRHCRERRCWGYIAAVVRERNAQ
jgi:hypothetical protein